EHQQPEQTKAGPRAEAADHDRFAGAERQRRDDRRRPEAAEQPHALAQRERLRLDTGRRGNRDGRRAHARPPQAKIVWPVTKVDSSDSRNRTTCAISDGSAIRFSRVISMICALRLAFASRAISVSVSPGATQLTRTCGASAAAV